MLINALIQAFEEIKRNLFRSLLTALGIIIGIASVVAMVNIGKSASKTITQSVSKLGSNNLFIIPGQIKGPGGRSHNAPLFDLKDVTIIKKSLYTIEAISPLETVSVLSIYKNKNYSTMLKGINNDFFVISDYHLKDGEFFEKSDLSAGKNKCIIGQTVYDNLFFDKNPIGKIINLNNFSCEVIGVLKPKGADTFGIDQDDVIFAPVKFVQRRFTGSNKVNLIVAKVKKGIPLELAKAQIRKILRQIRNLKKGEADNFSIRDLTAILNTLKKITSTLTLMLGAVAAISLIVGGIGIMNIMLVSVTERTREIGLRMAIGATKNDILSQFLIEASVLSSFGGIIGILLGVGISFFVEKFMRLDFVFDIEIIVIATLFSIFIGIIFGFIPARKAANLNPIDALRYE